MKATDINHFIPEKWDDRVFYFASELQYSPESGWRIVITPEDCLVGLDDSIAGLPSVIELRDERPKRINIEQGYTLCGRILVSAGVFLTLEDKVLLFQRDALAPFAPLKWTSAAGRLDHDPLMTALKELHEEVIVLDAHGKPIYIDLPGSPYLEQVQRLYSKTLLGKDYDSTVPHWKVLVGNVEAFKQLKLDSVRVQFGSEEVLYPEGNEWKFITYYNENTNTFEILLPVSVQIADMNLKFFDGEYQRKFKLFTTDDLNNLTPADLVSTISEIRARIMNG